MTVTSDQVTSTASANAEPLTQEETIASLGRYGYGWSDSDEAGASAQRGLSEDVVRDIEKTLADERPTQVRFVIEMPRTRQLVGTGGFHTISELHGTAEISYDVTPSEWGKGVATAACRAATKWGFEERGWHRIQGTTVLANLASQRVLERRGFQREGLLRNFRMVQGHPTDYWLYSSTPGELRT